MKNNYADLEVQPKFARNAQSAGTDAVVTIAADANEFWAIDWISWSYSADPVGGRLTVTIGGTVVWEVDITVGGPGHIEFLKPLYGSKNAAVVITLKDGSATNKVNVRYR